MEIRLFRPKILSKGPSRPRQSLRKAVFSKCGRKGRGSCRRAAAAQPTSAASARRGIAAPQSHATGCGLRLRLGRKDAGRLALCGRLRAIFGRRSPLGGAR